MRRVGSFSRGLFIGLVIAGLSMAGVHAQQPDPVTPVIAGWQAATTNFGMVAERLDRLVADYRQAVTDRDAARALAKWWEAYARGMAPDAPK